MIKNLRYKASNPAILYCLFSFFFTTIIVGQVANDYRTTKSGEWTDLTVWEKYNGSNWITVTAVEGYPCQLTAATRFVSILNGHNVTCSIGASASFRPSQIQITAVSNNTSLTFTSTNYFEVNGSIVMTATSTGSAFLNVNAASVNTNGALSLGDTSGSSTDCEVVITTGTMRLFSGNVSMAGAADENAIRLGSGVLRCNGSISGGSISADNGTVEYSAGAAQTVGPYTFNNLTLSGSSIKTISATATILGNLTISGSAKAQLPTGATIPVNSLILGSSGSSLGSWGSTTSLPTPTHNNNSYFETNASAGILTVTTSTPDVTVTIGSYTYTGLPQGPNDATNTGTGTSYTFSYRNNGGTSFGPTATPPTNAGNYFVTATVAANGIWTSRSSAPTAFSIVTRPLTITANNATKIIGDTHLVGAGSTAFNASGLQNGETIGTITIASTGATAGAAVGTYNIVPSVATGGTFTASNYAITYTNGTLTVNPALGDYRTVSSGNWSILTTWQRWNGTAWAVPTVGEGFPGQESAATRVTIVDGHNITYNTTITQANRPGTLILQSGSVNTTLDIQSGSLFVNSLQIQAGTENNVQKIVLVTAGFLNCGSILISDTTNNTRDSELQIVAGNVFSNGNITMAGASDENAIRFSGSGTVNTAGNISGGTIIAATGTVTYSGSIDIPIGAYAFNNLILSTSGIKSLNAGTTIAGNLTISGTVVANLNTTTYLVNSLTLGTLGRNSGTWGNNVSPATYKNDTYFAASSGIITVTIDTRPTPVVTPTVGTYIYTGLTQGPNAAINTGTGTSYTFSYTGVSGTVFGPSATLPSTVGNYTVIVTLAPSADGLYLAATSAATSFAINRASLTITANTTIITQGDPYPTTGATDFTSTGLQNGETIGSISLSNGSGGQIGTFTTFPSAAIGGTFNISNYAISYVNGSVTINPRVGDYRTKASGNWNVLSIWERWNGTAWVEPTVGEGYPAQYAQPFTVYIQSSHHINGNVTIGDPGFRLKEVTFSAGAGDSSLSVIGGNAIQINNQVRLLPGGNRTINIGQGFLSVGAIQMSDTGDDNVDMKVTISTGALFVSGNLVMNGPPARNFVEFTGLGSLQFINNGTMTGGALIPSNGSVYYNGPVNQTVGNYAYANLYLRGDGTKTVPGTVTISNHLTIDGSAIANLNTGTTYTVGTLTLGCRDSEDGTWGSSTSTAFYQDDIYFEPTTGLIAVTIDSSLKTPVTGDTQPSCSASITTGTITITPQYYANNTYSFDNGATFQTSNVKTGLSPGTYIIIIRNSKGCFSPTTTVTIVSATRNWNGSVNNDWNTAANWTPPIVPTADNCVVLDSFPSPLITGNAVAYSVVVKDGVDAIVETGHTLTVTDFVRVNAGVDNTFTFRNNASLVQINNNAVNSGNIQYRRTTPSLIETDYTYWSSPVENQSLAISPDYSAGRFFSFNAAANDWSAVASSTIMEPAVGYIIRGQRNNSNPYSISATFTGKPNNGIISTTIGNTGTANLIGNPYPSAVDADDFIAANSTNIEGTIYFWTHNTAIQNRNNIIGNDEFGNPKAGSGLFAYTSDDYASYNSTGGVVAISGGVVPNGNIAATQAFFVNSIASGGVSFTNAMRRDASGNTYNNSQFFKTKNQKAKQETTPEKHRLWLNFTNARGAFKQILVGYILDATNEYDSRYDGESFDGNEFVDFYSINSNKKLVIQGRALPFDLNDRMPMGYRTTISGEFKINIEQADGLLKNQDIFLEDKLTNTIVNLQELKIKGGYTFTTTAGVFDDRFVLLYKDRTLGFTDNEVLDKIVVSIKNKKVKINSYSENITKVTIYDLLGRQIYSNDNINSNEYVTPEFGGSHQALIIETSLQNGKKASKKIVL